MARGDGDRRGRTVFEEPMLDPKGPAASYQLLAELMHHDLQWDATITETPETLGRREARAAAERAEALFQTASSDTQEALARLLPRLVRIGGPEDADPYARQRIDTAELDLAAREALSQLATLDLVEITRETDRERAQLKNTFLIAEWWRLKEWLQRDRDFLVWRQKIRMHSEEWQRQSRPNALLLRGPALTDATRFAQASQDALSDAARAFVLTSRRADFRARAMRRVAFAVGVAVALGAAVAWFVQRDSLPLQPLFEGGTIEVEYNDTAERANTLHLGFTTSAEIAGATDIDFF
jgi:hypothetical protein